MNQLDFTFTDLLPDVEEIELSNEEFQILFGSKNREILL